METAISTQNFNVYHWINTIRKDVSDYLVKSGCTTEEINRLLTDLNRVAAKKERSISELIELHDTFPQTLNMCLSQEGCGNYARENIASVLSWLQKLGYGITKEIKMLR
jgi:uncharacterized protein Smg (DUF494 family)